MFDLRNVLQTAATLAVPIMAAGCVDQDPFGLSCRDIAQDYCLNQFDEKNDNTFYLMDDREPEEFGGGVLEGTVERIGWNDRYIIAERRAVAGGDLGWMVVDLNKRYVSGPYRWDDLKPDQKALAVMSPTVAWKRLG